MDIGIFQELWCTLVVNNTVYLGVNKCSVLQGMLNPL